MKAIFVLCAAFVCIAVVVLLGLRIAKATRLWPAALLVVTAPLEVYRSSSGAGLNLSLFRIALAVGVIAFVLDVARGRLRLPRPLPVAFLIYGALLIWQLISLAFVTSNHTLAYRFVGQYAGGLLAAWIITYYVRRDDLRLVAGVCGAAAILPLMAAIFRVISVSRGGSGDLPGLTELPVSLTIEAARQTGSTLLNGTQRLNGTFADPNQFGFYISTAFLIMTGVVCGIVFLEKPIRWRAATSYIMLALATAIAIIGTYSRSSWLLAGVGLIILATVLGKSFWSRRRALTAGVVGVVVLGITSPLIVSRLSTSEAGNVKSTQVHEHTMQIALKLIALHPLIGVGLGGYGRYAGQPPLISSSVSTFLTVGAELGILGLVLLVGAVGVTSAWALREVLRSDGTNRALLAGFFAAWVALAAGNIIGEVWMNDFQWVLFGLLLALTKQLSLVVEHMGD